MKPDETGPAASFVASSSYASSGATPSKSPAHVAICGAVGQRPDEVVVERARGLRVVRRPVEREVDRPVEVQRPDAVRVGGGIRLGVLGAVALTVEIELVGLQVDAERLEVLDGLARREDRRSRGSTPVSSMQSWANVLAAAAKATAWRRDRRDGVRAVVGEGRLGALERLDSRRRADRRRRCRSSVIALVEALV